MHTEGGFEVLEQDLEGRLVWRMKDLRILSALEVRTVVPSGDHWALLK